MIKIFLMSFRLGISPQILLRACQTKSRSLASLGMTILWLGDKVKAPCHFASSGPAPRRTFSLDVEMHHRDGPPPCPASQDWVQLPAHCHPERSEGSAFLRNRGNKSKTKSSHVRFLASIKATLFVRLHPSISFFRSI